MDMNSPLHQSPAQRGSMLLEALIAILIFSMGILAIVGMQASSISMSSDAKYRSDASMLASQYIGKMWENMATAVSTPSVACANPFVTSQFDTYKSPTGTDYIPWLATLQSQLPNATALVQTSTVLSPGTCLAGSQQSSMTTVSIEVGWQLPGGESHKYSTTAMISAQKQN